MLSLQTETLAIAQIRREKSINCRAAGTDHELACAYFEAMNAGAAFPPVVVFRDADGVLWLADGFHRCAAAEHAGGEIEAEVRHGGEADALLFAAGANAAHGRPRSAEDKRRAVLALHARPEWHKRGARWIAEHCRVSPTFASETIKTVHGGQLPPTEGRDGKVRKPPKRAKGTPKAVAALESVYARVIRLHKRVEPRAHHDAFLDALMACNPQASLSDVAAWLKAEATAAAQPVPIKRRRVVEPKSEPLAAAGGER